jgi:hypothetical protein
MEQSTIIRAFNRLADTLSYALDHPESRTGAELKKTMQQANYANAWFTEESIIQSIKAIISMLQELKTPEVLSEIKTASQPSVVALIMAGNIPMVGFQDFLHVLLTGNIALCKLSDDDRFLLPCLAELLTESEPGLKERILFSNGKISGFDAVIATGSNNSARYFEYYFGKYPHIIRKNRNSVAVLTGDESIDELTRLADDIFMYFGLGCRNVSSFLVPRNYDFTQLIHTCRKYSDYSLHGKYMNNFDYYRAIHMVNSTPFTDGGFFMLIETDQISSPPGIIHYRMYEDISQAAAIIRAAKDELQCVVSSHQEIPGAIPFGTTQQPRILDFADGVNTIDFLNSFR